MNWTNADAASSRYSARMPAQPSQRYWNMARRSGIRTIALFSALLVTASRAETPPARSAVAIVGVSVIDVEHGRSVGPRTVVVADGRIVAVTLPRDAVIPESARRVSGRGRFLIPGLVDMHVHLFNRISKRAPNAWAFPLFIANGVTGVREMNADAGSMAQVRDWRRRMHAGELLAPHILAVGIAVSGTSPDDAAHQTRAAAAAGADFIKVFSGVPAANWHSIVTAARTASLRVAGHVPAGVSLLAASAAGQHTNEHLTQAVEACSSREAPLLHAREHLAADALTAVRDRQEQAALADYDATLCATVAAELARDGQAQVPTQILAYTESRALPAEPDEDPRWRYLRSDERARWLRILAGRPTRPDAPAGARWQAARRIVGQFHRAGVPILAGTDAPMPLVYPGFSLHEELALLVDSGLSPREALRAATFTPAAVLGVPSSSGSVAVGKRADLVLLDGDPTKDIRNTRRIRAVLIDGRLLLRADLDAALSTAATRQQ